MAFQVSRTAWFVQVVRGLWPNGKGLWPNVQELCRAGVVGRVGCMAMHGLNRAVVGDIRPVWERSSWVDS